MTTVYHHLSHIYLTVGCYHHRHICVHTGRKDIEQRSSTVLKAMFIKVELGESGDAFMNRNRFSDCLTHFSLNL